MVTRTVDGIANLRAQFHNRLMHFGLDLFLEEDFSAFENLVDMRAQFACFGIDDGELFFDAEGKCVVLCAHGGAANLRQKQCAVIQCRSDLWWCSPSRMPKRKTVVRLCKIAERAPCHRRLQKIAPA